MTDNENHNTETYETKNSTNDPMEGSEELWELLTKISHIALFVAVVGIGFWAYSSFTVGKATSIAFLALATAWAAFDVRGERDWKKRIKTVAIMLISYAVGYFSG
ncbi:hypothetical protein [Catenovulum agarivorans]|uniref:hypothetical protein n=1 Tax=Catenovulum agarivorans TaxID=1172192 RepID=UPI00031BF1FF|nr:hypothetical protein [Catenovulum agarivorans]